MAVMADAASKEQHSFRIYNDTNDYVSAVLVIQQNGDYSGNLAANGITPGTFGNFRYGFPKGAPCTRSIRVLTASGKNLNAVHDFCQELGIHVTAYGLQGSPN